MKLYYLDNEDCCGIFSSVEKAKASYFNFINRCKWKHIKEKEYSDGTIDLTYIYTIKNSGVEVKFKGIASISPYELDEDNG